MCFSQIPLFKYLWVAHTLVISRGHYLALLDMYLQFYSADRLYYIVLVDYIVDYMLLYWQLLVKGPCILFNVTRMETIVCTTALSAGGGGGLNLQPNFQERGELDRTSTSRGGCLERGGDIFQGRGCTFHKKRI